MICDEVENQSAFKHLRSNVIELNNYHELMKVFKWNKIPILDRPDMKDFDYIEDVNERRIRDTESLATVIRNTNPKVLLEIGTANGMGTVLMSVNAPNGQIYTVNIPPEEASSGSGGKLITVAITEQQIGIEYRKRNLNNIHQIMANTLNWQPNIGKIDVAFIDGSHDKEFVVNDTKKILPHMNSGGFVIWHDFNLELTEKYNWIGEVCKGVEELYKEGLVEGRIFHIRDSWMGIYQVR